MIAWDPNWARAHLWDCFGGQAWIMTRHASCCVFCAQITSGTSRSARTYICTSCVFFPVALAPRQRSHLWSCSRCILLVFLEVNFPRLIFIQLHIFMFLFLSIPPSVLLFPAVSFHFAFRHVCLHSRPPNNPINTGAPSLGPRVSLFSKVSYRAFSYDVIAAVWCTKTILWELNSFLMSMM